MLKTKASIVAILVFYVCIFLACVPMGKKVRGLKPIYPELAYGFPTKISNLQPEFRWEASKNKEDTYDFVLWDESRRIVDGNKIHWESPIYSVENLKQNSHKIKISLKPDTFYYWTVRIRRGNKVSGWSSWDEQVIGIGGGFSNHNMPFLFKTLGQ